MIWLALIAGWIVFSFAFGILLGRYIERVQRDNERDYRTEARERAVSDDEVHPTYDFDRAA